MRLAGKFPELAVNLRWWPPELVRFARSGGTEDEAQSAFSLEADIYSFGAHKSLFTTANNAYTSQQGS